MPGPTDHGERSVLQRIGLAPTSELIYLYVLRRGRADIGQVAERFGLNPNDSYRRLEGLREQGLISRRAGERGEYAPVDPRYSLRAISDALSESVRRIHDQTPTLAEYFDRSLNDIPDSPQTQVLSDPDAVAGWYARLQHQAVHDFMAFDRPPYVTASLDPLEVASLDRGVNWRTVYAASSFEAEDIWDEVESLARQGEQARVAASLPVKLAIVDRSVAMVSLTHDGTTVETLISESGPLVAAMSDLFEFYWQRALAIPAHRTLDDAVTSPSSTTWPRRRAHEGNRGVREPSDLERSLLALIGAGVKDEAVARQLGLSPRTLRRRTQDLMNELGAVNRFQAGVEASRRGWL